VNVQEKIRRLEAEARSWDREAASVRLASSPNSLRLKRQHERTAAALRAKAHRLKKEAA
jgi:hypothetical protein